MQTYVIRTVHYLALQSVQLVVLTLVIAFAVHLLRHRSSHAHYLLWLIVLGKCLVPPVIQMSVPILPETLVVNRLETAEAVPELKVPALSHNSLAEPAPVGEVAQSLPKRTEHQPSFLSNIRNLPPMLWLGLVWLIGAAGCLAFNLLKGIRAYAWISKARRPVPADLQTIAKQFFSTHMISRPPRIWQIEGMGQPFVWGLVRGHIYVPPDFMKSINPKHATSLIAHELCHCLRFDPAVNILQIMAQCLYWFHPGIWWVNQQIRLERERCCDEMVVSRFDSPTKEYCTAIVETLAHCKANQPAPLLAVAGRMSHVEARIRNMMQPGKKFRKQPGWLAIVIIFILAMGVIPTSLVFTAQAGDTSLASNTTEEAHPQETESDKAQDTHSNDLLDSLLGKSLHYAAAKGDLDQIEKLLDEGVDINALFELGQYSRALLQSGETDPNLERSLLQENNKLDPTAATALHWAVRLGRKAAVELLLAKGADVRAQGGPDGGGTPLHRVTDTEIAEILIARGADINAKNGSGMTPLGDVVFRAISDGQDPKMAAQARAVADLLKAKGADVLPLHWATFKGDVSTIKTLLAQGTDVNARDPALNNHTALHLAAMDDQIEVMELLLDAGADVNVQTSIFERTALSYASATGARLLIEKGADVNLSGRIYVFRPVCNAILTGHAEKAKYLIQNGADVRDQTTGAPGLLDLAFFQYLMPPASSEKRKQGMELIKMLVAAGAEVNDQRRMMLDLFAQSDTPEIAELYMAHGYPLRGFYIESMVGSDSTALHTAAKHNSLGMVQLFIKYKLDLNPRDRQDRTPLTVAQAEGNIEIVALLKKNGATE